MNLINNIFKYIEKNFLTIVIILVIISLFINNKESFSTRIMYMYNPITRNQSYDLRGDTKIKKEKVGKFYESSYENNYLNTEN